CPATRRSASPGRRPPTAARSASSSRGAASPTSRSCAPRARWRRCARRCRRGLFRPRSDRGASFGRAVHDAETSETRPYGRRAFLGLLAGGVTAFAWAGPVSRVLSPLTSSFSQLTANLLPLGGWRIYTITGVMPDLDAAQWRLRIDGLVERPA